ncbi:MAG: hypothetical protein IT373_12375 [Polyangiaceae bacterium]|nr:hypothetical protein [Polyangiaceae bacterium]
MTKRTTKHNWAEMDNRIRGRKTGWSAAELKELAHELESLPDVGALSERSVIEQPALGPRPPQGWGDDVN